MPDPFAGSIPNLSSPVSHAAAVTPSDTEDLEVIPRCVYIGGSGSLVVTPADSNTPVTLASVAAGQFCPIRVKRVWATGTTATGIVAWW